MGKQRADPIDANFLNGITKPSGSFARVERQAKTHLLKRGTLRNIIATCLQVTKSLASDKSRVARVPSFDAFLAREEFTVWSVKLT
jgi:hypothetical protein